MDDGRLGPRYPAPYASFVERRRAEQNGGAPALVPAGAPGKVPEPGPVPPPRAAARKLSWKEQRELEELDSRIAAFESQKKLLLDEIEKSGDNYERLRTLTTQLESLEGDLDAALERWFELSAIAETIN
jgi:ATP-binding cassette subfamily F protein uup